MTTTSRAVCGNRISMHDFIRRLDEERCEGCKPAQISCEAA